MHDFVFNNLINFWINLIVSAGFTYWVNHSAHTIKLPGMKEAARPAAVQKELGGWIRKIATPLLGRFHTDTQNEISGNMAGVLTLTAAGHAVMIPSVWLGAKVKAPMVKWLNRMHYGADAMDDTTLKTRHAAIEAEERPTLLGSVVGRFGTIIATQTTAYTLGSNVNFIRFIGEKTPLKFLSKFRGIDDFTSQAGNNFGGALTDMMPERMGRVNKHLSKDYTWSLRQLEDATHRVPKEWNYGHSGPSADDARHRVGGGINEHFGKYLVSDIMYSLVTAATVAPAINFFKKFIPGLTYTPEVSAESKALLEQSAGTIKPRRAHLADAAQPALAAQAAPGAPGTRIQNIQPENRVAASHHNEVTA